MLTKHVQCGVEMGRVVQIALPDELPERASSKNVCTTLNQSTELCQASLTGSAPLQAGLLCSCGPCVLSGGPRRLTMVLYDETAHWQSSGGALEK